MAAAAPRIDRLLEPETRPLIGMVHLPRLAGGAAPPVADIVQRAVKDAETYASGGFDAVLVENLGDAPYPKETSEPHVGAVMTRVVAAVADRVSVPVGVNVLRNDARTALAVCHATGARFIRVNLLTGVAVTDQGLLEGRAPEVQRYRTALGLGGGDNRVAVLADIDVKHAVPLVRRPLDQVAAETVERAGADVLLASGTGTGAAADMDEVRAIVQGARGHPVWIASGVTPENLATYLEVAHGAIIGTAAKHGGDMNGAVDPERVRRFVAVREGR